MTTDLFYPILPELLDPWFDAFSFTAAKTLARAAYPRPALSSPAEDIIYIMP
jgi:hypothetical protein